ncbi:MAG: tRNA-modifying protein YgfZ [Methyloprofundus sp.]|nr:MAG: tRNA-modifying protein YgfZ [Methyloprofundus sp.]
MLQKNNIMNTDWTAFLNTQDLSPSLPAINPPFIAPLSHLAILAVSGQDAANFLQGQTTCNIKELNDASPNLGALCNAKGRTISTFIIIKQANEFQLILTVDLLEIVKKKLQMYILRADVQLTDQSDALCIIGVHNPTQTTLSNLHHYPQQEHSYLFIASPEIAQSFWMDALTNNMLASSENSWLNLDIQAGIPWLYKETTEKFVPQMLNLDKLDAISFEKGCYTGQEIVARTHYLGQNKRAMYQASSQTDNEITPGTAIIDSANDEVNWGEVILTAQQNKSTQLLVVLKDATCAEKNLQLNNQNKDKITLI